MVEQFVQGQEYTVQEVRETLANAKGVRRYVCDTLTDVARRRKHPVPLEELLPDDLSVLGEGFIRVSFNKWVRGGVVRSKQLRYLSERNVFVYEGNKIGY